MSADQSENPPPESSTVYISRMSRIGPGWSIMLCFYGAVLSAQSLPSLRSPDGDIELRFETGPLAYSVTFRGKPLIERSALRLDLQGQEPALGSSVRIIKQTPSREDTTYRLIAGKASTVRNHYNGLLLETEEHDSGRKLDIEARAYDDAIAFRYVIPDQVPIREYRLTKETTEFRLSKDATTYALVLPNFRSSYESEYIKLNASAFSNRNGLSATNLIGLPLLMEVPGVAWMAITEADLRGNAAMYLVNPATEWGGHRFES